MKASIKWIVALGFVLFATAVLLRTYAQIHHDPDPDGDDQEQAVKQPSRVSVVDGQTVITLDVVTQHRVGIAVARLRAVDTRPDEPAAATVLATQGLVMLRNNYVGAHAQVEKAEAQCEVSHEEYERLLTLYKQNQNASLRAVQSARGAMQADQINLDAARKQLQIASFAVQQVWGGVVARWVANNSPELARVLEQKSVLIQLTVPQRDRVDSPPQIRVSTPNGGTVVADYISPFPQVDPRIQGVSELYLAHADRVLAPGMNLMARLPVGKRLKGVLIPHSAIVWWQGAAWVYEQTGPTQFIRREAPRDVSIHGDYFAAAGFAAGNELVVRGAQILLSEEFRSQIQPEH